MLALQNSRRGCQTWASSDDTHGATPEVDAVGVVHSASPNKIVHRSRDPVLEMEGVIGAAR
jgi:hypothetical protein